MIEVRGLTKRYGSTVAVDRLSFEVPPGAVTGFLGLNGSGKSTTMRMILGLDSPDAGHARIGGQPYRRLRWPLREAGGRPAHLPAGVHEVTGEPRSWRRVPPEPTRSGRGAATSAGVRSVSSPIVRAPAGEITRCVSTVPSSRRSLSASIPYTAPEAPEMATMTRGFFTSTIGGAPAQDCP